MDTSTNLPSMKTYTIADKEEAKKLIGRRVRVVNSSYVCMDCPKEGILTSVDDSGYSTSGCSLVYSFQLVEKILDDIEVGDMLIHTRFKSRNKVVARLGDVIGIVTEDEQYIFWLSVSSVRDEYCLLDSSPEPKVEKTVSELEKELGLASGSLRIKKDD